MSKPQRRTNGPGTVNPPSPAPVQPEVPPIGEPGILPRRSLQDIENEQNPDFVPEDFDPDIGLADPRDLVGAQPYENMPDEAPAPSPAPSE
jgi:hypothetical protein